MKKVYFMFFLCLIIFCSKINAQVTLINANHGLSGYPIFGNSIFLTSDLDSTLWSSDGTLGGTKQYTSKVKIDLDHGAGVLNNKIYFAGVDGHGSELWVTDGTDAGTNLVQDILVGSASSSPSDFFQFKNDLYFTDSTASGRQLYKITGSNGSVAPFKTFNQTGNSFSNSNGDFFSNNNLMYFTADDGSGTALWVSDGTAANTKKLTIGNTTFGEFAHLGNLVIFTITTPFPNYFMEIWKTDGTTTTKIQSFNTPLSGFGGFGLLNFNNKIYFAGTDGNGTELWSTDGATATMVKDINKGPDNSSPELFNAVFIGNKFIFSATDTSGTELWTSDGTENGTSMLKNINTKGGSNPVLFPVINYDNIVKNTNSGFIFDFYQRNSLFNGSIFFSADDGTNGTQLWKTNGTAAGTVMVSNNLGSTGSINGSYYYTKQGLYFSANDGTRGTEPWFSDGTTANTNIVEDLIQGAGSSDPEFSFIYKNNLFFTGNYGNSNTGYNLYKIDATTSVLPIRLVNFTASVATGSVKLDWTTASEINSSDFVIQRSIDGIHFTNIGSVAAAGNSALQIFYTYNDQQYLNAGADVLFYRLQLNDIDGKFNYSQVQSVTLNSPTTVLKIYPNPVHDQLSILFSTHSSEAAALKITDNNGRQVYQQKYSGTNSSRLQSINVSVFAKGTYFVQLITPSETKTTKFVKE